MGIENTLGNEWDLNFPTIYDRRVNLNSKQDNKYYFVFDSIKNEVEFLSDQFYTMFGWLKEEINFTNIMQYVHPDDYLYVLECERISTLLRKDFLFQEHFRYHTLYSYRLKSKSGAYFTVRQSYHALSFSNDGQLMQTLVNCEVEFEEVERKEDDFQTYDYLTGININTRKQVSITKREKEIIELINQGLSSSDISKRLFLSKHTIDTHRKNMLQKNNVNSMQELINLVLF